MINTRLISKAYFTMERALTGCGIPKKDVESFVEKACEGFGNRSHIPDGTYGTFTTHSHTADAIMHMFRVAQAEALERNVVCKVRKIGTVFLFSASRTGGAR